MVGSDFGPSVAPRLVYHVIDSLRVGGAQTHLLTMLREEAAAGRARHHVLALYDDGPIGEKIRDLGIPVDVVDISPFLERRQFLQAAGRIERWFRSDPPAVVEAHLTFSRLLGLYAAWRTKVPLRIAFEHGDLYLNSWKFRLAHFIAQQYAHRIIVVSHALQEWATSSYLLSGHKTTVLHNPVDLCRFAREHIDEVPGPQPKLERTKFVTVGTLGTGVNKRVDVAIRALADARIRGANVTLTVCGDGPLRHELERLSQDLGVGESVIFTGMRSDVPDVLATCDAYCHAAPFEPFGIVAVEALASGLPVIAPDTGGMKEAIEIGRTGMLYPACDHVALGRIMCQLHEHPADRIRMGRLARRYAVERFSVEDYMDRLYALYGISRLAKAGRAT